MGAASLIESLPLAAATLDGNLKVTAANGAFTSLFERPREDLLGAVLPTLLGYEGDRFAELAKESLRGSIERELFSISSRSPETSRYFFDLAPEKRGEEIVGVIVCAESVAQPADEQAYFYLQMNEVQRLAGIGTYRTDIKAGTWTGSEGFCRIFGFEPNAVYGEEEFRAIVHPEDIDWVLAFFGRCIEHHEPFDCEYRCVHRKTGATLHVRSVSKIYYDAEGRPEQVIGIKQDITPQKNLERQLVSSQRIDAIGRLASGIAHDFNNALAAIQSFADLMEFQSDRPALQARSLSQIRQVVDRAQDLTRKLLDFTGGRSPSGAPEDLNSILESMSAMLSRLVGAAVLFQLELSPSLWSVAVERVGIEQVLTNLVVNARDAMKDGGVLVIRTYEVSLEEPRSAGAGGSITPGDYAVVEVRDTGSGIAPEIRDKIFEPFATTKENERGTGLGLATSLGIVTGAGGCLEVEDNEPRGTVFKVYLPRSTRGKRAKGTASGAPIQRALLVDDNSILLGALSELLTHVGYDALTAGSGHEALKVFEEEPGLDVVITDVVMPGMSGLELMKELRDRDPKVPMVCISGNLASDELRRLPPGVPLLQKPFGLETLREAIRAARDWV